MSTALGEFLVFQLDSRGPRPFQFHNRSFDVHGLAEACISVDNHWHVHAARQISGMLSQFRKCE
jgi:hypothetical protein